MRITALFLVLAAAAALATSPDGCTEGPTASRRMAPAADATVTITLEDEWELTWAAQALGMDAWESGSTVNIVFASRNDQQLNSLDPSTGGGAGSADLAPDNTNCFGVVWNNNVADAVWHTNDWTDNVLYYSDDDFVSWQTTPNPAGNDGRGMDFDGTDYWQSSGSQGVYRFQPGTGQELISIPGLPGQISGLSVFPYDGDVGLVVTFYQINKLYFYVWNGTILDFLGDADTPYTAYRNYGLAYCDYNEMLYWSYQTTAGTRYIAELSFEIEEALTRSTWGQIKSAI
jgi:hypothetical protein